ncbi:hypothetical protein AKO1_015223 [Acrasis kona]|uniref:Cyclic nucleotide-binding domain-containing protein n=1 Tax=Acrasis kona TaxID=1008807 RepID=A0AAW2ZE34_9EUKA
MDFAMTFIILYNLFLTSYLAGFETYTHIGFQVTHIVLDVFCYLNILSHFFAAVEVKGLPVYSRKVAFIDYAKFNLWIDLITYFPMDWFVTNPLYRLFRMLSLYRFGDYYSAIEVQLNKLMNPLYLRIFNLSLVLVLIIHIMGCATFYTQTVGHLYGTYLMSDDTMDVYIYNTQMNTFSYPPDYNFDMRLKQYLGVISIMVPVTVGYASLNPMDPSSATLCIVNVVVGSCLYSILLGTVGDIVLSMDRNDQIFRDKIDNLREYLKYRSVSSNLQQDSKKFYTILQRGKKGIDFEQVIGDLDIAVKRKIAQYLHKDLVAHVPLFKKCGDLFVEAICQKLKYTLLLKGYYCVTAGDKGREMFFIGKGSVQVVSADGKVVYATLREGAFFGEIALVEETRRTASIRAAELCELYVLYKEDFDNVVKRFPAAIDVMKEDVENRKRQLAAKKEEEEKKLKELAESKAREEKMLSEMAAEQKAAEQNVEQKAQPEQVDKLPDSPNPVSRFKVDMSKVRKSSNSSLNSPSKSSKTLLTRLLSKRNMDSGNPDSSRSTNSSNSYGDLMRTDSAKSIQEEKN